MELGTRTYIGAVSLWVIRHLSAGTIPSAVPQEVARQTAQHVLDSRRIGVEAIPPDAVVEDGALTGEQVTVIGTIRSTRLRAMRSSR